MGKTVVEQTKESVRTPLVSILLRGRYITVIFLPLGTETVILVYVLFPIISAAVIIQVQAATKMMFFFLPYKDVELLLVAVEIKQQFTECTCTRFVLTLYY